MVAILLVAFVGVGAIAADIGRFYVVTGELQTAADAAALAGGLTLMKTGGQGTSLETAVDDSVISFVARTNRANNAALAVIADSVKLGYYTPPVGVTPSSIVFNLAGRRANAVVVSLAPTTAPTGLFAKMIGNAAGLALNRQATAWVGNVGSNCVRPWAFPYLALWQQVSGSSATTIPAPALDPVQFFDYMQQPNSSRMFVIRGQNESNIPATDGEWNGFNFTGNAGKPSFTNGITGCFADEVGADASQGKTLPGQAFQYVNWASSAIDDLCHQRGNSAACYFSDTSSAPGVVINSVWGDPAGTGSATISFQYVGQFMLTCYFKQGPPAKTCPAAVSKPVGTAMTGYQEGTVVGYIMGLKDNIITPDDIVGNAPSNKQRILLVK
jgi:hypothetical protein